MTGTKLAGWPCGHHETLEAVFGPVGAWPGAHVWSPEWPMA